MDRSIKNWPRNFVFNRKAALLCGSVIQANGRLAFEDGLRSGGPLHCVSHCTSVRTNLADIMDTLKKFKVAMLSEEVGC